MCLSDVALLVCQILFETRAEPIDVSPLAPTQFVFLEVYNHKLRNLNINRHQLLRPIGPSHI